MDLEQILLAASQGSGHSKKLMSLALFLMALDGDEGDSVTTEHFGDKEVRTAPRWQPVN